MRERVVGWAGSMSDGRCSLMPALVSLAVESRVGESARSGVIAIGAILLVIVAWAVAVREALGMKIAFDDM